MQISTKLPRIAATAAIIISAAAFADSPQRQNSLAMHELHGEVTGQALQSDGREDRTWSELIASMDKMHMSMSAIARSGISDVDFVRLMLPHHQAAIDMAKTELLYGKDPQMRRLAQEIITDQKLEMELMQGWLKQTHAK